MSRRVQAGVGSRFGEALPGVEVWLWPMTWACAVPGVVFGLPGQGCAGIGCGPGAHFVIF